LGIGKKPARARIHGRNQHEVGRVFHGPHGTGNGDVSILQGLSHHLENIPSEFGQLIEKQHPLAESIDKPLQVP